MSDLVVGRSEGITYSDNKPFKVAFLKNEFGETIFTAKSNIRTFIIQKVYNIDDLNFSGDEMEVKLFEMIEDYLKPIMDGDYYHNKINDRIEGFFTALDYLGIKYEKEIVKLNEEF